MGDNGDEVVAAFVDLTGSDVLAVNHALADHLELMADEVEALLPGLRGMRDQLLSFVPEKIRDVGYSDSVDGLDNRVMEAVGLSRVEAARRRLVAALSDPFDDPNRHDHAVAASPVEGYTTGEVPTPRQRAVALLTSWAVGDEAVQRDLLRAYPRPRSDRRARRVDRRLAHPRRRACSRDDQPRRSSAAEARGADRHGPGLLARATRATGLRSDAQEAPLIFANHAAARFTPASRPNDPTAAASCAHRDRSSSDVADCSRSWRTLMRASRAPSAEGH
jgi:hypothetical protein